MAGIQMLPYGDVDSNLRAMAGCAEGFGRHAIGGLHGSLYIVTNLAGTLTYAPFLCIRFNLIEFWKCE